jgi:hypothetical protein
MGGEGSTREENGDDNDQSTYIQLRKYHNEIHHLV